MTAKHEPAPDPEPKPEHEPAPEPEPKPRPEPEPEPEPKKKPKKKKKPEKKSKEKRRPRRNVGDDSPPPGYQDPREILDLERGIERRRRDLAELLNRARKEQPDRGWLELPDTLRGDPIGEPVSATTWRPLLAAPTRLIEALVTGQRPIESLMSPVPDKSINEAARSWEIFSRHLGLSSKGASLAGAVIGTAATFGAAAGRAVLYLVFRDRFDDDDDDDGGGNVKS